MPNSNNHLVLKDESKKIGIDLSDETINQLGVYIQELVRWNKKTNLTGHKGEKEIISDLFIDSLAFYKALKVKSPSSIMDIGTGAGFPGLPIKISDPDVSVTLVEPNLKKVSFLHHIIGTLALKNVSVESKRIEDLPNIKKFENFFDFILLKALRFNVCLPYVRPLLSQDGKVVLGRSKNNTEILKIPGFSIHEETFYELPFGFGERVLMVLSPSNT